MPKPLTLTIHVDGASRGNPGPAAFAFVILHDDETVLEEGGFLGTATNNFAEYTAVIKALEKAAELKATSVLIRSDSELLVRQMNGEYRVKHEALIPLHQQVKRLANRFQSVRFSHVPREQNREADRLCNEILDEAKGKGVRSGRSKKTKLSERVDGEVSRPPSSWQLTVAEAERRLREAAHTWVEAGLDRPTPHEVLQDIIRMFQERGFLGEK